MERLLKCNTSCRRLTLIPDQPNEYVTGNRNAWPILRKFFEPKTFNLSTDTYEKVKSYFKNYFGKLKPTHFNDAVLTIPQNTSPGYDLKKQGYTTKGDVLRSPEAYNNLRYYCHRVKEQKPVYLPRSRVVVVKSKFKDGKFKNRTVWTYPLQITAIESIFYAEFGKHIKNDPFWIPKPESHHKGFCGKRSHDVDFSNFDSSIHRNLIKAAFSIIYSCIDFSTYACGSIPYSSRSLRRLFKFIENYFIYTPFLIELEGRDCRGTKSHGVPSGSMFTNLVDTIVSRLVLSEIHENKCKIITYGDDAHIANCIHGPRIYEDGEATLKIKRSAPNEHGCLTYCKAECHNGISFHSGQWYANILWNLKNKYLISPVAHCLQYTNPTYDQFLQLRKLQYTHKREKIKSPFVRAKLQRVHDYIIGEHANLTISRL
uniref:RdRp n=1 Tax=Hubei partiti-like virus 50 TaxID=1923059 RepID=A0A1L3KLM8_9VIRU|nr:RdRp [Hubei partiti-like virus 50]